MVIGYGERCWGVRTRGGCVSGGGAREMRVGPGWRRRRRRRRRRGRKGRVEVEEISDFIAFLLFSSVALAKGRTGRRERGREEGREGERRRVEEEKVNTIR